MEDTFIRKRRREIGLNVPDLAREVGVSETAAWNWDRGTSIPKDELVAPIANALGISASKLREGLVRRRPSPGSQGSTLDRILLEARENVARYMRIDADRIDLQLSIRADHEDLTAAQGNPSDGRDEQ